ncbi:MULTISPECIES: Gfo/Idh/MocA family protein [unclassified Bradyrhizobium]|uniref:Gfo/Idh/MocA family protein n=1 Tax=unclassified Bradyrhizobium TaxID=2631580 RepID=UPI0029165A34|nr:MULTISPECIES: Gfo/Idh/MocA family oxidoreductase [unclassified Bradyrhizobium]
MKRRIIVIGLGQSGARFIRACLAVGGETIATEIVGGVDVEEENRTKFSRLGVPCYPSIEEASRSVVADVAIVTVPEHHHYGVLLELKRKFPSLVRVMCEKPLAASMAEACHLVQMFTDEEISLNFVERFSPVVNELRQYITAKGRKIARVNCFWGKYRVKDARPALGVVHVELAHPIDLILMLAEVPTGAPFEVASVVGSQSNFDIKSSEASQLDTVHVAVTFATGLQVLASTSLLWSRRKRRIEAILMDADGIAAELAVLEFDNPIWDLDQLEIYDLRAVGGTPKRIHFTDISRGDWPANRLTIGKVCRFVEANLLELDGHTCPDMARLHQGAYVQEVLQRIMDAARTNAVSLSCFGDTEAVGRDDLTARIDFLSRMLGGGEISVGEFIWDYQF